MFLSKSALVLLVAILGISWFSRGGLTAAQVYDPQSQSVGQIGYPNQRLNGEVPYTGQQSIGEVPYTDHKFIRQYNPNQQFTQVGYPNQQFIGQLPAIYQQPSLYPNYPQPQVLVVYPQSPSGSTSNDDPYPNRPFLRFLEKMHRIKMAILGGNVHH